MVVQGVEDHLLASCTTSKEAESNSGGGGGGGFSPVMTSQDLGYFDDLQYPNSTNSDYCLNNITKKLSHNAYERDRRKKMNELYSSLRSLLPDTDHSKKLSIPSTVSRVIKYIPELQRHVDRLIHQKEAILREVSNREEQGMITGQKNNNPTISGGYPVISSVFLSDREVMIQICMNKSKKCNDNFLSRVLGSLEDEGFKLLDASTFSIAGERTSYSLHLQVNGDGVDCKLYGEQITDIIRKQARAI